MGIGRYMRSTLLLLYNGEYFMTKKQCDYKDIRLPKWWHMAITDSSLTVSHIFKQPQTIVHTEYIP